MTNVTKKWRAGAIALVVAGAIAVPAGALARTGAPASAASTGTVAPAASAAGSTGGTLGVPLGDEGHRGPRVDLGALAAQLGVTTEALRAALDQAKSSVGPPARGSDLTAHRAAIASSVAATLGLDPATVEAAIGDGGFRRGSRGARDGGAKLDTLATTLGVTTDALQAAFEQAKSVLDRPAPGSDLAAYRAAIVNSVAATLGLDPATVEAAIGDGGFPFGRQGGRGPRGASGATDGGSGVAGARALRGGAA